MVKKQKSRLSKPMTSESNPLCVTLNECFFPVKSIAEWYLSFLYPAILISLWKWKQWPSHRHWAVANVRQGQVHDIKCLLYYYKTLTTIVYDHIQICMLWTIVSFVLPEAKFRCDYIQPIKKWTFSILVLYIYSISSIRFTGVATCKPGPTTFFLLVLLAHSWFNSYAPNSYPWFNAVINHRCCIS